MQIQINIFKNIFTIILLKMTILYLIYYTKKTYDELKDEYEQNPDKSADL